MESPETIELRNNPSEQAFFKVYRNKHITVEYPDGNEIRGILLWDGPYTLIVDYEVGDGERQVGLLYKHAIQEIRG
jgi:hypothetical protein